jgi:hypothetical membrane protein
MEAAQKHTLDRIGIAVILLPAAAILLLLVGAFPDPVIGQSLIWMAFVLGFVSVPLAGLVALQSRKTNRRRLKLAVIGLGLGVLLSTNLVIGWRTAIASAKANQDILEMQQEAESGPRD